MKKQYLLAGLMVTALGFTACDEDYTDWAEPQSNPQEETVGQVTASFAAGSDAAIAMDNNTKEYVSVASVRSLSAEGATFTPTSFTVNGKEFPYTYSDGDFLVKASQLDSMAQVTYMSRAAQARELTVKAKGAAVLLDGHSLAVESGDITVSVTPATPLALDPNGYYIVGDFNGWAAEEMTKVSDYIYQYKYDNPDGTGHYYKFMLGSYKDWDWQNGHIIGCGNNGDASLTQFAVWGETGEEPGAPVAQITGKTCIQLDVENYVITVSKIEENLFMTGSEYGWGDTANGGMWKQLAPVWGTDNDYWLISYFISGEMFKFAPQAGWGNDFGGEATLNDEAGSGIHADGTNLVIDNAGWYLLHVVNGADRVVNVYAPDVYLIGNTASAGWNVDASCKFTVPETKDGDFVSPAFVASDEVRVCVSFGGYDWWKTEFIVLDGQIVYRGKGDDQQRVSVTEGQSAYLNFMDGTGEIK